MSDQYIPKATLDKIATPAPVGTRHQAAIEIAVPMIGNGVPDQAVFAALRGKFEPDVTDSELWGVIKWARNQRPTPSIPSGNGNGNGHGGYRPPMAIVAPPIRTPIEQCDWWTSGARQDPSALARCSPVPIPEDFREQAIAALSALYSDKDVLNIVCAYIEEGGKARPGGAGRRETRDYWIDWCKNHGVPKQKAGAWLRMNPCCQDGSGKEGAITDADITDFRFTLLESDAVPIPVQLATFRRLKLPIAMILMSGGKSAHAWVRVGALNAEQYKSTVDRILAALKPFGVDQANGNESRLSRLPGAHRELGAAGDGMQRLLWLDPNCAALTEKGLVDFEESLKLPAIEEHPLKSLAQSSITRYEELYKNQGKLGVPTGIEKLDALSGGMKKGQTWVIAGSTGGGKSTLALHVIKAALNAKKGVLLFSLEMDREEIFDLLVADMACVDRNKFNNGAFRPEDFDRIAEQIGGISKLPLYIEDSAMTGVEQIRLRTLQLNAAGKIGLVVVDYAQFVNPEWTKDSREQQVATISHRLRALARECRLPFVVLSQLNDEGKLRESRVLAHNANVVIMVEVEENEMTAKVFKGRGIPLGDYKLGFDRAHARLISEPAGPTPEDDVRANPRTRHQSQGIP